MRNSLQDSLGMHSDLGFDLIAAPLHDELALEVELFLVELFEHGNYSFRSALRGHYSTDLNFVFCLVRDSGCLVGVGTCLYDKTNPAVAIIGPVGVARQCQRQGIGSAVVKTLEDHLTQLQCKAIYIGVSPGNGLHSFYERLGFKAYSGIVLRKCPEGVAQYERLFADTFSIHTRPVGWEDYAGVSALAAFPGSLMTFDYPNGLFSSRYTPPIQFLPIFPNTMTAIHKNCAQACVLVGGHANQIVGFAQVTRSPAALRAHIANLEFYVHDSFLRKADKLIRKTLAAASFLGIDRVRLWCVESDVGKRAIVDGLCAKQVAVLPEDVHLDGRYHDVLVYEIKTTG